MNGYILDKNTTTEVYSILNKQGVRMAYVEKIPQSKGWAWAVMTHDIELFNAVQDALTEKFNKCNYWGFSNLAEIVAVLKGLNAKIEAGKL